MADLQLTLTEATLKALLAGDTQQTIQTLHQQLLQQLLKIWIIFFLSFLLNQHATAL